MCPSIWLKKKKTKFEEETQNLEHKPADVQPKRTWTYVYNYSFLYKSQKVLCGHFQQAACKATETVIPIKFAQITEELIC